MPGQTFISADGEPIEWLQLDESDKPVIPPDTFGACRLLMAVIDEDEETLEATLTGRPAVPLLGGVLMLAERLGALLYGDRLRLVLDLLVLKPSLDLAGTADEDRLRRTP